MKIDNYCTAICSRDEPSCDIFNVSGIKIFQNTAQAHLYQSGRRTSSRKS